MCSNCFIVMFFIMIIILSLVIRDVVKSKYHTDLDKTKEIEKTKKELAELQWKKDVVSFIWNNATSGERNEIIKKLL